LAHVPHWLGIWALQIRPSRRPVHWSLVRQSPILQAPSMQKKPRYRGSLLQWASLVQRPQVCDSLAPQI
jgi:hypothetical protein